MAFYKKKVEKLAADKAAEFLNELQHVEQQVVRAAVKTDAAEKYMAYVSALSQVQRLRTKVRNHVDRVSETGAGTFMHLAGWGTGLIVAGAAVTAAITVTPVLIFLTPFAMFGAFSGDLAKSKIKKRNQDILKGSVETLQDSLTALEEHIQAEKKVILKTSLPELASSVHFDDIHARHNEVKEAFAVAVAKETLAQQRKILMAKKPTKPAAKE